MDDLSPLLCLHGIGNTRKAWDGVVWRLQEHHRVIVPTLAGHSGGPALPPGIAPTVASLADQLERELDDAGVDSAHVAGNSLGGLLALELGARGRALSVTAFAPAGGWEPHGPYSRVLSTMLVASNALFTRVGPKLIDAMERPLVRSLLMGSAVAHPRRVSAEAGRNFMAAMSDCPGFASIVRSIDDHPIPAGISAPVRIVWSGRDVLVPGFLNSDRFTAAVPHVEMTTLKGVGHLPVYDAPARVAEIILAVTSR